MQELYRAQTFVGFTSSVVGGTGQEGTAVGGNSAASIFIGRFLQGFRVKRQRNNENTSCKSANEITADSFIFAYSHVE
jgi:hypothetical protein